MKHLHLVILILIIFPFGLFSQPDSTGWVYKNGYREQKLKVDSIIFIRYSKDGKFLFTFGKDNTLRKWDVASGDISTEYKINAGNVFYFDMSADEKKILVNKGLDGLSLFKLNDSNEIPILYYNTYPNNCEIGSSFILNKTLLFHPVLDQIITAASYEIMCFYTKKSSVKSIAQEGRFEIYSADSGTFIKTLQDGSGKFNLLFSPDGNYAIHNKFKSLENFDESGKSVIFQAESSTVFVNRYYDVIKTIPVNYDSTVFAFSADSRFLASLGVDKIDVWKVPEITSQRQWDIQTMGIDTPEAIGLTNDGKFLATVSKNNDKSSLGFWWVETGDLADAIDFDSTATGWRFASFKDSSNLAAAGNDGIIRIFDNPVFVPLVASFAVDTMTVFVDDTVKFHDTSKGNPTTWHWDFGDSATSNEQNPVHSYSQPGFYSITLIITKGQRSDTAVIKSLILVKARPSDANDNANPGRFIFSIVPNPVTESSVIYFFLDKPQPVQVKIFNQLGQEVAQIADGYFSAGSNTISFNPNDYRLMSGLYYIQLTAGPDLSVKEIFWQK